MTRPQVASRSEVARGLRASGCAATPRRGSLLYNLLKMAGVAAVLALSGNVVADSCIVSGSTNRTEVVTCMAVAINSELDTRPAPEIRLDELNLRTDEVRGVIITFQ